MPNLSPQMHQIISSDDHFTDVRVVSNDKSQREKPFAMMPVLGKKNYTDTIGRNRRTQIIDESSVMVHEIQHQNSNNNNGDNFRIGPLTAGTHHSNNPGTQE